MSALESLLRTLRRQERDARDIAARIAWRDPYRAEIEQDRAREAGRHADAIAQAAGVAETIHDLRQRIMQL